MTRQWTPLGRPVRYNHRAPDHECSGWVIAFRAHTEPGDDPDVEDDDHLELMPHIEYLASDASVIIVEQGDLMEFYS